MILKKSGNRRSDIQYIRAISVIAVLLFHSKSNIFSNGYLGVDAFFVISGFVVSPLIINIFSCEPKDFKNNISLFWYKRLFRLAPALVITLVSSALLVSMFGRTYDLATFYKQGLGVNLMLANLVANNVSKDYFHSGPNPLIHTWSLSVEEQIYIFLPAVIFVYLYILFV